jgi:thiamine-monophosphate kinase
MRDEFEFIHHIKEKYALTKVGDDCAVLPYDGESDMLITSDMLAEDIDFRLDWTTPELLGHKALAVSLSDIAAMGGEPKWAMLSIGVPEDLWHGDFLDRFYDGWQRLAGEYGVELVGGDVSRVAEKLVIDSTVLGKVAQGKAILRSGAKEGDGIFITGSLGGAAAGLRILEAGRNSAADSGAANRLITRQLAPNPRLDVAALIARCEGVTAMIDISDGLSSDLRHICEASGCGAEIDPAKLPIDADIAVLQTSPDDQFDLALNGGEDFELLFTADPKLFSAPSDAAITPLGTITASVGSIELIRDGQRRPMPPRGYRHFS